ncbi:hypothetical protein SAMN06295905_0282 [Devosia lucknowensis]|uniref:Uncharacterized protein n=1 Tax=Devosia lucknowensis TaxID=1096929 RepID=A0A1Y6EFU1_9HYPH|nr:hypothetical protein [Devosia lucknowensis]SMQ59780.1 hypothetical protein SAMN06295905_0282 [Devosia lucknowensis]
MNEAEVDRLVGELLATGEMNEDTVADLERILAEAKAGQSYPDDIDYLRALHARILSSDQAEPEATTPVADDAAQLRQEISRLQAELADARQTIAELETRLASGV